MILFSQSPSLMKYHPKYLAVPYPELFWRWYTGLGSQIQPPKCSKVLISGVNFCQRSLSQSQESNVLSYSERKIAKKFPGFRPRTPLGRAYSAAPDSRLPNGFSPRYTRRGTPINCWIQHCLDLAVYLLLKLYSRCSRVAVYVALIFCLVCKFT